VTELANDGRDHGSLHGCRPAAWRGIAVGWISIAGSQRLQVRLKSRCPIGFSLAELDHQIANAQTAREAIEHALRCPHHDIVECPTSPASSPPASPANHSTKPTRTSLGAS
jgi:hypothetical protein